MHVAAPDDFRTRAPSHDAHAEDPRGARAEPAAAVGAGGRRPPGIGRLDHCQRARLERDGADVLHARAPEAARPRPVLPRRRSHRRPGDAGDRQAGAEARATVPRLRQGERNSPLLRREPDHPAHAVLPGPGASGRRRPGSGQPHIVARRTRRGRRRARRRRHRGGHGAGKLVDPGAGSNRGRVLGSASLRHRRQGRHPPHARAPRSEHRGHGAVRRVPRRGSAPALDGLAVRHRQHDRRVRRPERNLRGGRSHGGMASWPGRRGRSPGGAADADVQGRCRSALRADVRSGPREPRAAGRGAVFAGQRQGRDRARGNGAAGPVHRRLHDH